MKQRFYSLRSKSFKFALCLSAIAIAAGTHLTASADDSGGGIGGSGNGRLITNKANDKLWKSGLDCDHCTPAPQRVVPPTFAEMQGSFSEGFVPTCSEIIADWKLVAVATTPELPVALAIPEDGYKPEGYKYYDGTPQGTLYFRKQTSSWGSTFCAGWMSSYNKGKAFYFGATTTDAEGVHFEFLELKTNRFRHSCRLITSERMICGAHLSGTPTPKKMEPLLGHVIQYYGYERVKW